MDRTTLIAAAVLALAVGSLAVFVVRPFGGGNVGGLATPPPSAAPTAPPIGSPSASPSLSSGPTTLTVPAMTETFVSSRYGYSVRYPADWSKVEASQTWWPPDWKAAESPLEPFDILHRGEEPLWFRTASAPLPEDVPDVNGWIEEFLIFGDPNCVPPRARQELISIDGAPGRLWDACSTVEATIVVDRRVYMFTLSVADQVTNARELFDAFAATIDLRPEDAELPSPNP